MNIPSGKPSLYSLTYISSAIELFSASALLELLKTSRRNNTESRVTGVLLYKEGSFMQVLEGEEEAIQKLHDKIARDPRHDGLITLLQGEIARREFGEWSMGFYNLSDPAVRAVPGYNEFLNTPLSSDRFVENPSYAAKLLHTFKRKM